MDIGNFVPQHIKDYYASSESKDREFNNSWDTREPYKPVSEKSSACKIRKKIKKSKQKYNVSRNCNEFSESYNVNIVQPLKDITQNETNKYPLLESLPDKNRIINDKMQTAKLDFKKRTPIQTKFNFTADMGNKLSSGSLVTKNRT